MPSSKPKPSEVATETKRHYLPIIKARYSDRTHSYLFQQPLEHIQLQSYPCLQTVSPPQFHICTGDPADFTISWEESVSQRIPLICAANDKRAGGDWETGVVGYEERLCRRSSLFATLSTPGPESLIPTNYPITSEGGIYSECVVVFRGPHDQYKKLDRWFDLPVVSVPPTRWPKLKEMGTKYAFPLEREMVKRKIRAALRICVYYGHTSVTIGDFGLGNGYRNPPQELAEIWREVFLYDPDLRGRFEYVAFCFEDPLQSTAKLILDDIAKKNKAGHGHGHSSDSKSKSKSHGSSSSSSHNSSSHGSSSHGSSSHGSSSHGSSSHGSSSQGDPTVPTDFEVFQHVFNRSEVQELMSRPDPRYGISMLTS